MSIRKVFAVIVAAVIVLGVSGQVSPGARMIYEATGLLVNLTSDLNECSKIQCVSGSNCSAEADMKCSKFTYCGELIPNATGGSSSSLMDSSSLLLGDACLPGVSIGKACTNHTDCVDYWAGAYCSHETHVCTRGRVLNETCDQDARCTFPLSCENGFCVNKYMLTAGESCYASVENGGCHLSLYCSSNESVCKELPTEGEACIPEVGCVPPSSCSASGKCVAPMSSAKFEPCVTSLDCREGLVCARNNTCLLPADNYTYTPKCTSNDECPLTSYCHCDYVTGNSRCLPLPKVMNETIVLFNSLVECISLGPDYSFAHCQSQLVAVQRAINASAIIDYECSRIPPVDVSINLLLLVVPVTILILILILVVIVKLGVPKDK